MGWIIGLLVVIVLLLLVGLVVVIQIGLMLGDYFNR